MSGSGKDFTVDRASDPTPAEGALFEVPSRSARQLTAQMTDDTSRAPQLYTLKQTMCQIECQRHGLRNKVRENVQNVQ